MITIKEIAKRLHMSTTTVSNVIHGKTKEVSPETIAKVQSFLDEVGYVPNISARNLAQNQSKIIGLVLKYFFFPFFMTQALTDALYARFFFRPLFVHLNVLLPLIVFAFFRRMVFPP